VVGAQPAPAFEALEKLPGISNYFIGKDPSGWHTNVPQYSRVVMKDLYPGVDMAYYGNQGKLEYDFQVKPGARVETIRLKIEGAAKTTENSTGGLDLEVPGGKVSLAPPVVYQEESGQRRPVKGRFRMAGEGEVRFDVDDYDRTRTLVIDPTVNYSTMIGGLNNDGARGVAGDSAGNAYVTGYCNGGAFPVVAGSYQTAYNPGGTIMAGDAFLCKLDPTGTTLIYSTYFGGLSNANCGADLSEGDYVVVDGAGDAYVAGTTDGGFPTTAGAYQTTTNCGGDFVLKLNPAGNSLLYSTYVGNSGDDDCDGFAVDPAGEAYLAGSSIGDIVTTAGAFQPTFTGGRDAFVIKFNAAGSTALYATYFGPTAGYDIYGVGGLAIDPAGYAYITGYTDGPVPTTAGSYSPNFSTPIFQTFVTEFNTTGTGLMYSTYLKGNAIMYGQGIAVDSSGDAYVTGLTAGLIPTTAGAYDTVFSSPDFETFVTELNPTGSALVYSTYLGGSNDDEGYGITVDANGDAYVTGEINSGTFPTTAGAYQTTNGGGSYDAFATVLNPTGTGLLYSTYLGGGSDDQGFGIALDPLGNFYVVGRSGGQFPTTAGAYQTTFAGNEDAFLVKFNGIVAFPTPTFTTSPTPTLSLTPTFTPLFTSTRTSTPTWTLSPTPPAITATYTPTAAFTLTSTSTVTSTQTPVFSYTPSYTGTPTLTPVFTYTPSFTGTPTLSPTFTYSPTLTYTPTITLTPTITYTPTITFTPTATVPYVDIYYVDHNYFQPSQGPVSINVQYSAFPGPYSLKIYNTAGELVKDLSAQNHDPSTLEGQINEWYKWDGANDSQNQCASGVYILYLIEPFGQKTKKIILIH